MTAPVLEVIAMTKRFGTLSALSDASLRVAGGSVHALLGENGAGKSTLVKCIMGYYRADEGAVVLNGREVSLGSPREAQAAGIGMVYQHFTLVPSLTVLENLVMARRKSPGRINWGAERTRLEAFLATMPFQPPLDVPVSGLSTGEKQKAEILKQLYLQSRFLILDEPTSVLTPNEADEVLGLIRDMAHAGRITVLIITHKFREVFAFADQVTVLRRGRVEGSGAVAGLTADALARLMVGDAGLAEPAPREQGLHGEVRMELRGLSVDTDAGEPAIRAVSLRVAAGEIVGIAGVSGNGQAELVQVLAGQRRAVAGAVLMHGEPYHATRAEIVRHRVALLPEEPLRNACVGRMCVAENMAFRTFDRAPMASGIWLRPGRMRAAARELVGRYQVRTASVDVPIDTLSGGNVQRAVLARELSTVADVLIVANPVFGLDFAAVADIHTQILAARRRGTAILLVSEDLDELLEMADRILVLTAGRFVHETTATQADRMEIGRYMAGHRAIETA
jgi:general nucleoside transport system ATP-binding protein